MTEATTPVAHATTQMQVLDLGLLDYNIALQKQLELVDLVRQTENHPGFLLFCSHPPVVTTGRQTVADDIFSWSGPIVEVSRGGRATYHGPSQSIVYPLINIQNVRKNRSPQEVRGFLRDIEKAIVLTLADYGIEAHGKTSEKSDSPLEDTGVWIGSKKIASVGLAVKKWVTYHGAAINLYQDEQAFQGIHPCGYKNTTMISLEELLQKKIDRTEFNTKIASYMQALL